MEDYKSGWKRLAREDGISIPCDCTKDTVKVDLQPQEEKLPQEENTSVNMNLMDLLTDISARIENLSRCLSNQNEKIDSLLSLKKMKTRGR